MNQPVDASAAETKTGADDPQRCRLCDAPVLPAFRLTVLGRHDVGYFRCTGCGSMQTERPYWLDEAYAARGRDDGSHDNLNNFDTGAAQRNIVNMAASLTVARTFGLRDAVDEGGGDGLLCRLLRDYELNAFVHDRFARSVYAQGFETPDFAVPDLLTAFEVFEHFANPATDIADLFARQPKAVLITTEPYHGQGIDWWYLIPDTGHHVFFYSERAFQLIAERFGYDLLRAGAYTLFTRRGVMTPATRLRLSLMLRGRMLRLTRAMLSLRTPMGPARDFERAARAVGMSSTS